MLRNLLKSVRVLPGISIAALLYALLASTQASAGFIDLSDLPDGDQGTDLISTPEGDLLSLAGNWFKSTLPAGDFICPLAAGGCGSFKLSLTDATEDLIFDVIGYSFGDSIEVIAQTMAGDALRTITHTSADPVVLRGVVGMQMVQVNDSSTAGGFGFGNFRFGDDAAAVPAPGALSLVLLGLFGMRMLGRRRAL